MSQNNVSDNGSDWCSDTTRRRSYNYSIEYKPRKYIPEADCLSRPSLNDTPREDVPIPSETVLFFKKLDTTPVTSSKIALMTKRDQTLSKVLEMTKRGIFISTEE